MIRLCYKWAGCGILWKDANWTWSECQLVDELINNFPGVDATTLIQPWMEETWNPYKANEKDKEKRIRLIKLVCKVKGQEFEQEKEVKDFKVTVDDIKMVVKAVSNIDLDLKLEE